MLRGNLEEISRERPGKEGSHQSDKESGLVLVKRGPIKGFRHMSDWPDIQIWYLKKISLHTQCAWQI